MDVKILKNSYVVFIITFIALYTLFYLFGIGYTAEMVEDKKVIKPSWKYPLGLSLIIWTAWHFFLYPPDGEFPPFKYMEGGGEPSEVKMPRSSPTQKINMKNWY